MVFHRYRGAGGEVEWNKGQNNWAATLKQREPVAGMSSESMVGRPRGGFSHELVFKQ